jgi:hypothetical protein
MVTSAVKHCLVPSDHAGLLRSQGCAVANWSDRASSRRLRAALPYARSAVSSEQILMIPPTRRKRGTTFLSDISTGPQRLPLNNGPSLVHEIILTDRSQSSSTRSSPLYFLNSLKPKSVSVRGRHGANQCWVVFEPAEKIQVRLSNRPQDTMLISTADSYSSASKVVCETPTAEC